MVITAVHSDTTNLDHSELNQNSPFHHQPVQPNDNVDFCSKSQIINSISFDIARGSSYRVHVFASHHHSASGVETWKIAKITN